jgi:hypothetical protein
MYCLTYKLPAKKFYYDNRHLKIWTLIKNDFRHYHRKNDKPAIEHEDGSKEWYPYGLKHRDNDLPAAIWKDGKEEYWLKGIEYFQKEYPNGTKEWYFDLYGERDFILHQRGDKPAIIYSNGDKEWWCHGARHRENGPAVIYGEKQYWFYFGRFVKMEKKFEI